MVATTRILRGRGRWLSEIVVISGTEANVEMIRCCDNMNRGEKRNRDMNHDFTDMYYLEIRT
jgi:hypothetical protein